MNGLMGQMDDFVMDIQAYTEDEHPVFAFLFGGSGDGMSPFSHYHLLPAEPFFLSSPCFRHDHSFRRFRQRD